MIYLDHNIIDFAISKHSLLACFVLYIYLYTVLYRRCICIYMHLNTQVPDYLMNFHHLWIFLSSTLILQLFLFPAKNIVFNYRRKNKNMKWISVYYNFHLFSFSQLPFPNLHLPPLLGTFSSLLPWI